MKNNFIKVYKNIADPNFCDSVISFFEKNSERHIPRQMENLYSFTEINLSECLDSSFELCNHFYAICNAGLIKYREEFKIHKRQFPERYGFEEFRVKKYIKDKEFFSTHVDVLNYDTARRFLVMFLYLNDVENGGKTEFPQYDKLIEPKKGNMLIFPATWTHLHRGMRPLSNDKYILGTYLHYV